MRKYYYQITYQTARYTPSKQRICYEQSIADAKLYAYTVLYASNVAVIACIWKP